MPTKEFILETITNSSNIAHHSTISQNLLLGFTLTSNMRSPTHYTKSNVEYIEVTSVRGGESMANVLHNEGGGQEAATLFLILILLVIATMGNGGC